MRNDLRHAARALSNARGLTVAAVLCLSLGIGGTTIVASVMSALVLHSVPTPDPSGLVMVTEVPPSNPSADESMMAPANYVDLARRNRSFSELAAPGGVVGTLVAVWGVAAVRGLLPAELVSFNPGGTRMDVSGAVLAFTAAVSLATALLVGAVPPCALRDDGPDALTRHGAQSVRSTRFGSTRDALRAGATSATRATASSTAATRP
jgi:hypothetical protein